MRVVGSQEWWGHRVCTGFVLLANGTAHNKVVNKHGKSRQPEVVFNDRLGTESSKVTQEGERMDRVE